MKIGVLALQGAFREHIAILKKLSIKTVEIRLPSDLKDCSGLIIPGGESTTIGKLMQIYNLDKEIIKKHQEGMAIYGTCSGAILLAKNVIENNIILLNLIDITVLRNAYGRQIASFEQELHIDGIGLVNGIFIRAPKIVSAGDSVKILNKLDDSITIAKTNKVLVSTFHPELTDDTRVHEMFISMCKK